MIAKSFPGANVVQIAWHLSYSWGKPRKKPQLGNWPNRGSNPGSLHERQWHYLWIKYILFWPHRDLEGLSRWVSAQFRGHLRDNTNITDDTHHSLIYSFQHGVYAKDYCDSQMIFGDLVGLKLPEICLIVRKNPKKTHPGILSPGSNPGPLCDRRECYRLLQNGGQCYIIIIIIIIIITIYNNNNKIKSVTWQLRRTQDDWIGCCQMAVQGALWLTKRLSLNLNFSFLNRIRYFSYHILTRLGGPRSRPYTSRKFSRV